MTPETFNYPGLKKTATVKHYIFRFFYLFVFVFFASSVFSQTMEIGIYGGGCYYLGDLNPGKHFLHTQISYGILARYNIDTRWTVKISAYRGNVRGNSQSSSLLPDNNLSFNSPVTDFSAVAEFNFLSYFTGSRKDFISPYIYTGISAFLYDPSAFGFSLRSLGTEGQNIGYEGRKPYGTASISIPFGLGVKISVTRNLGMTFFWEMHKTFTDYLDDVSQTYYLDSHSNITGIYLSDPSLNHQAGMERGNPKNQDWYSFSGLTLTYKFNIHGRKKCRETKF
jgi:Domain of unknown function (DUF6089)